MSRKAGAASYRMTRSLRLPPSNRGVRCIAVSQSDTPGSLDNLAAETGDGDILLLDRDSFNLTSAADEAAPLVGEATGRPWHCLLILHIVPDTDNAWSRMTSSAFTVSQGYFHCHHC